MMGKCRYRHHHHHHSWPRLVMVPLLVFFCTIAQAWSFTSTASATCRRTGSSTCSSSIRGTWRRPPPPLPLLQLQAEQPHHHHHHHDQQPHPQQPQSTTTASSASKTVVDDPTTDSYTLEVFYEGRSCPAQIRRGESILAALERTGVADSLAMPSLPSDCRRGNCLTCVGKHIPHTPSSTTTSAGSSGVVAVEHHHHHNIQRGDDGLSPYMSQQAQKRGYILTCCSTITGNGVRLQLGVNQRAWEELYRDRLEDESTQLVGRAAMANVIRRNAEKNLVEWAKETEEILRRSDAES